MIFQKSAQAIQKDISLQFWAPAAANLEKSSSHEWLEKVNL